MKMSRRRSLRGRVVGLIASSAASVGACAHDEGLVPAPQASVVPGQPGVAYDQEAGVSIWVDGDAWQGNPGNLEQLVTPIRITVHNRGHSPVRMMYRNFTLAFPWGVRVNPLPPFSLRAAAPAQAPAVRLPAFAFHRFYIAPRYRWYYPGVPAWHRHLPHDPFFYDTYFGRWRQPLPTEDMLRSALPAGVIEPGGSVSGFLYFPDVPSGAWGQFTLMAELTHERDGQSVASLDVPLLHR
jgi:hypothetical protein